MGWQWLSDSLAREAENIIVEIELNARGQRASGAEQYALPYELLGRLLSISMTTVPDSTEQFLASAMEFSNAIEPCIAKQILLLLLNPNDALNGEQLYKSVGGFYRLFWTARWHSFGCPAVNIEGRLAASLMATETPEELIDTITPPWGCFVIRLPSGLVSYQGINYTHVVTHRFRTEPIDEKMLEHVPEELRTTTEEAIAFSRERAGTKWGIYGLSGNAGHLQGEGRLVELLGREERQYFFAPQIDEKDPAARVVKVLSRLATGVCQLAEIPSSIRRKSTKKAHQRWRFSKTPLATEYVLAPDVKISYDCTEAVRSYVSGDRSALPKYQWIVRGHWRNQACGPEKTERKRIWIQPHWKGPEDSPKLFREYQFAKDDD